MDTPTQDSPRQHAPRKNAGWVLAALVLGCQLVGVLGALIFPTGNTAWLLAPYLAWICFALTLNATIVHLN